MGLILCKQEPVKHPYYIENLGVHIYSSQELCYVIFNYPLIVLDNFINEALIEFIKKDLGMGMTALKLERGMNHGEDIEELLLLVLQECDYFSAREINQFQKKMTVLQSMPAADYAKAKADDLSARKQYGKAIVQYQLLLNNRGESYERRVFRGEVWNNLGVVYTRLFQFEKAFEALKHAYHYLQDSKVLKQIYFLTLINDDLEMDDEHRQLIPEDEKMQWFEEYHELKKTVKGSKQWIRLEEIFKKDSRQKRAGLEQMIEDWKKEYRQMV